MDQKDAMQLIRGLKKFQIPLVGNLASALLKTAHLSYRFHIIKERMGLAVYSDLLIVGFLYRFKQKKTEKFLTVW